MRNNLPVTQQEYVLNDGAAIISRTNQKGQITDCNAEFVEVSGFTREELIGEPHNLVRHPDMPAEAFRDLWATLNRGRPWSGIVKNRRKNGDHYWVRASVAPLPDGSGFSSVRTKPTSQEIAEAEALYARMKQDATLKLSDGHLKSGHFFSRLPALSIKARLALMIAIPLITLASTAMDSLLDLKAVGNSVASLYENRLSPVNLLAEINDLNQASMIEVLLATEESADPGAIAKHIAAVKENEAGITKNWQAFQQKPMEQEEKSLAENHLAKRNAMWALIKQALSELESGQREAAAKTIHQNLDKIRTEQEASIDQLKDFQVSASAKFYEASKNQFSKNLGRTVILAAIGTCLSVLIALWNLRHILSNLQAARSATRAIAKGELTCKLPVASEDELGKMLVDVAIMRNALHELVAAIRQNADALNGASTDLADAARLSAKSSASQANSANGMASAVEQLSVSIDMVDDRANQASSATQEATDSSTEGGAVIQQASTEMQQTATAINTAASSIGELELLSGQISSIINVIREVADQTNLLALNAAIEAARAGEQGRGFAVVADEVRKLAERTGKATGEIGSMIEKIQHCTLRAVQEMKNSVDQAGNGVALAHQAGASITTIQSGSQRVLQAVTEISHALKEQVVAAHEITSRLEEIAQTAENGSSTAARVADSASHLKELSAQTHALIGRFRIC
ncbi:MAG: methyl-accepting chemotaxis protein [Proteobacteria bacterium]|nr:methyl-accepting chemotaxis protein [Pseudomonadota bacterium]